MKKKILLLSLLMSFTFSLMALTPPQNLDPVWAAADTVRVTTADQLRSAVKDATRDRVIVLEFCEDPIGYYFIGKTGFEYPQKFINLQITQANRYIYIYGSFASKADNARMKLTNLKFKDIQFKAELGMDNDEMNNPFYISKNDSVMNAFIVSGCKFVNLGQKCRILRANASQGAVVKNFMFVNNYVENFGGNLAEGVHGQTCFQFNDVNPGYEFDNIVISENSFNGWHGNIFLNFGRQRGTSKDSLVNITIENNIFYKFGGNGTSARNFVEWTNNMGGFGANININKNIFYKNWEYKHFKNFRLHLFTPKDSIQRSKVALNVVDNYFEEDDVVYMAPYTQNLPITNGNLTYTKYKALTKKDLGTNLSIFANEQEGLLSNQHPIFTASSTGTYLGPEGRYIAPELIQRQPETIQTSNLAGLKYAIKNAVDGDVIELLNCTDPEGYYKLGKTGIDYPSKFVNLTVKAAKDNQPWMFGSLRSTANGKMKLKNYTISGLMWKVPDYALDAEDLAPMYIVANDSITSVLNINNCHFEDLGKSGGGRILHAKASGNAVVKKFIFDSNIIENFGGNTGLKSHGQTFMQWQDDSKAFEFDDMTFSNNVFHNWHGNQFINNGRKKTSNPDSTMTINFVNNTLYKFGGNGTSARNFIEWANKMTGVKAATININNNLFYKNWDTTGHRMGLIKLYTESDEAVKAKFIIKADKNFFESDSVMQPSPKTTYTSNLPLNSTNLTYASYSALTMSSMGLTVSPIKNEANADSTHVIQISQTNALYKAGLNGTFVGAKMTYNIRDNGSAVYVNNLDELREAVMSAADGDVIYLNECNDAIGYYNLGSTGLDYPSRFVDLTITPAPDKKPVVFGTFKSKTSKMKLKTFTLDGLTFDATDKTDAEGCAPIFMLGSDSITTLLNIKNCSFINLGKAGGGRIVDANSCDKSMVKKFIFENNIVENFGYNALPGTTGQTFMQWRNSGSYEFDNIILRNNTIHNWHGNQFLNINRKITSNPEGKMSVTFENNTLYKFGGNATSSRNFIEWANKMTNLKVANITINNNLFYKNWDNKNNRSGIIKLYEETDPQMIADYSIVAYCNYFYSDSVMIPSPVSTYACNLPIVGSTTLKYRGYRAYTANFPGMPKTKIFVDEAKADTTLDLTMYKQSALYTLGFEGACIGDPRWYTDETVPPALSSFPLAIKPAGSDKPNVYTSDRTLYVKSIDTPVTLYNALGQNIGTYSADEAGNGITLKDKGMIVVKCNGQMTRIMIK